MTEQEKEELKRCPFCGHEAMRTSTMGLEVIECEMCPAMMAYDGSFEALKAMWNNRNE